MLILNYAKYYDVLEVDKTRHLFDFTINLNVNEIANISTLRSSELAKHKLGFRLHSPM